MELRLTALLQLHLLSQLNTWLQWIRRWKLQDEARSIQTLGFGAAYIWGMAVKPINHTWVQWLWDTDTVAYANDNGRISQWQKGTRHHRSSNILSSRIDIFRTQTHRYKMCMPSSTSLQLCLGSISSCCGFNSTLSWYEIGLRAFSLLVVLSIFSCILNTIHG